MNLEKEAINSNWSVRELKRQIKRHLGDRKRRGLGGHTKKKIYTFEQNDR